MADEGKPAEGANDKGTPYNSMIMYEPLYIDDG